MYAIRSYYAGALAAGGADRAGLERARRPAPAVHPVVNRLDQRL